MADLLLFLPRSDASKLRDALLKDDAVSRAGLVFRDAREMGTERDGLYCIVSAPEPTLARAKEVAPGAEVVTGAERERVLQTHRGQSEAAADGFGAIFG